MEGETMELQTMPLRFRVWDKDEGRFIKLSDIYKDSHNPNGIELSCSDFSNFIVDNDYPWKHHQIIISQDTGLKDKNGKSIFTGDIISDGESEYDVFYGKHSAGCGTHKIGTNEGYDLYIIVPSSTIVSTIWQNSGLVEEK